MSKFPLTLCSMLFVIGVTASSTHLSATSYDVSVSSSGTITGVVNRVEGDRLVPVSGAKLFFSSVGNPERNYESATDTNGTYMVELPSGAYHEWLQWFGECPKIRRAEFKVASAEHLKFDFLVVACSIVDTERFEVPLEESGSGQLPARAASLESQMDVPLANQKGGYEEQLFPANDEQWPEIVISFGKYDNGPSQTTYFSLETQIVKNRSTGQMVLPKPLPVTITIGHYTVRASNVVLTKKTMTFEAQGNVSVSDGVHTREGSSATITFAGGVPKVKLGH